MLQVMQKIDFFPWKLENTWCGEGNSNLEEKRV